MNQTDVLWLHRSRQLFVPERERGGPCGVEGCGVIPGHGVGAPALTGVCGLDLHREPAVPRPWGRAFDGQGTPWNQAIFQEKAVAQRAGAQRGSQGPGVRASSLVKAE